MIIDKEHHRAFLLEMFRQVQIPGQHLEFAYEVKKAIESAPVQSTEPEQAMTDERPA
ncbi:hypothetical protein J1N44_17045 [Acidovorax temperans]|uniref:hypothetical protein n=1 Tax=Acidovorax temperans TaxID=80878 RepID=UPI001A9474ED|nr:hypothetical protein [Acidovorax temperans]MBO0943367.1 hypothetical protein [Acidovorax temperans]